MAAPFPALTRRHIQLVSLYFSCPRCALFLVHPRRLLACGHVLCAACANCAAFCPLPVCGQPVEEGAFVVCEEVERLVSIVQRLRQVGRVGGTCRVKLRVRERAPVWLKLRVRGEYFGKVGAEETASFFMSRHSGRQEGKGDEGGRGSGKNASEGGVGSVELEIPEEPDVDDEEEAGALEPVAESMLPLDIPEEPDIDSTQELDNDKLLLDALQSGKVKRKRDVMVSGIQECERAVDVAGKKRPVGSADVAEKMLPAKRGDTGTVGVGSFTNGDIERGEMSRDMSNLHHGNRPCLRVDASDIVPPQHRDIDSVQVLRGTSNVHSGGDSCQLMVASANDIRSAEPSKNSSIRSAVHSYEGADVPYVDSLANNGASRRIRIHLRIRDPKCVPLRTPAHMPTLKRGRKSLRALRTDSDALQSDKKGKLETVCNGVDDSCCERIRKRMRVAQNMQETGGSCTRKDAKRLAAVSAVKDTKTQDAYLDVVCKQQERSGRRVEYSKESTTPIPLRLRLRKRIASRQSVDFSPLKLPFENSECESPDSNGKTSDEKVVSNGPCNREEVMRGLVSSRDITPRSLDRIFGGTDAADSPYMDHEDNRSYSPTIPDSGSAPGSAGRNSTNYYRRAETRPPRGTVPNGDYGVRAETGEMGDSSKQICRIGRYAVCISGMDNDSPELALAEELLPLRGTELSNGFDSEPVPSCVLTVFDENKNVMRPRMVVLEAMARRIPIVNLDWLIASCRVGFLVDTEPFEAMGNHRREGPGVFERTVATLDNSFDEPAAKHMVRKAGQDIRRLLRAGGANVVDRERFATSLCESDIVFLHIHVVNDFGMEGSTSPAISAEDMEQIRVGRHNIPTKVVNMAWISDSLCSGQYPPPGVAKCDGESAASTPTVPRSSQSSSL